MGRACRAHLGLARHRRVVVELQQPVQAVSGECDCVPGPQFEFALTDDDGHPRATVKPAEEGKEKERSFGQSARCVFRCHGHPLRLPASQRANALRIRLTRSRGSFKVRPEALEPVLWDDVGLVV